MPSALILALALVAAPLLAGAVLGAELRHHRRGIVLGVLTAMLLTAVGVELLQEVGAWDVISIGALSIIGILLGAAGIDRAVILTATSLLELAALEVAVRLLLPVPQLFPDPGTAAFIFNEPEWDKGCVALYASANVDEDLHVLRRQPGDRRAPLVVHLGDSMTFGDGVNAEETFSALLNARQGDVAHANYGVWAVGTDFEYLLLQRILAAHSPAMVVLHIYAGNDVYDIDRPYVCCDAGPLLDYREDGPAARCPTARWRHSLGYRLGSSPLPYALRVATGWSHGARHLATAFSRVVSWFAPYLDAIRTEGEADEQDWEHFTRILTRMRDELKDRDIVFVADLLPTRQELDAADPATVRSHRVRERIAAIVARLGIRLVDPWEVLAAAVKRDGASKYFRGEHDIHLTPEGHRLLADWLATRLPPVR
jgi:hypothetical protein